MTPIAPSPIKLDGEHFTYNGFQPYETPRMLEIYEIHEIVKEFTKAAQNAIQAGFDGIEIHGANGYLIDQFLKDGSNKRNDEYGGMIENRSRFLFEIIESICSAIGSHRTAIRLSPSGTYNGMTDSNPLEDFQYICTKLNNYNLAYLHIMNVLSGDLRHGAKIVELKQLREVYKGTLIANGEYTKETANNAIENNLADAISFGTLFISNPNLPLKFSLDAPLISPDSTKFYTQDEKGYTDYPSL